MDSVFQFTYLSLADSASSPGGDLLSPTGTPVERLFSTPLSAMSDSMGGEGVSSPSVELFWYIEECCCVGYVFVPCCLLSPSVSLVSSHRNY
jgi:hypothetical protein